MGCSLVFQLIFIYRLQMSHDFPQNAKHQNALSGNFFTAFNLKE